MPSTFLNLLKSFSLFHTDSLTEKYTFWLSFTYSLINGTARIGFGYLYDKFSLKILKIVFGLSILIGSTCYFTSEIPGLFAFYPILSGFISSSLPTIVPAIIVKVYGVENSSEVSGIVILFYGFSSLSAPIISKILNLSTSTTDLPYLFIFEFGGILGVIGLLTLFTINEERFDYKNKIKSQIMKDELQDVTIIPDY